MEFYFITYSAGTYALFNSHINLSVLTVTPENKVSHAGSNAFFFLCKSFCSGNIDPQIRNYAPI